MSLMRRIRDMTVATLNDRLESSEDPVRLIDNYLRTQKTQIGQAEALHQQCVNHALTLRQQYVSAEQLRDKREQQAIIALKAGEEQAARIVLQEKLTEEERWSQYKALYEQGKQSIVDLEEQLQQLKSDYQEVYNKRQYYVARLESVRLQQKMNERMGGLGSQNNPRLFHRLEERVVDLELETRALRDVRRVGQEAIRKTGTFIEQKLEKELAGLRLKLEQKGWSGG